MQQAYGTLLGALVSRDALLSWCALLSSGRNSARLLYSAGSPLNLGALPGRVTPQSAALRRVYSPFTDGRGSGRSLVHVSVCGCSNSYVWERKGRIKVIDWDALFRLLSCDLI
eukprot:354064-Chlamydomonas_euryale.AAC.8